VVNPPEPDRVRITALGRFAVSVGGHPVPATAWQSRKARDLLRILVARRGRPVARDELAELLWPGEPADRVGHRLSVALSTARQVLDPDRRAPADHAVSADAGSLALNLSTVTLDAETFAGYAGYGLVALREGRVDEARAALEAAERAYAGDFLEDEPYDDVAAAAREELRAGFLQVVRALAGLSRRAGRADDAVRYLLRALAVDPYDEPAHRALVEILTGNGRHGEARRARERYAAAMAEIGVPVRP
jgi:DNA-binding SARP family transcriptional activator